MERKREGKVWQTQEEERWEVKEISLSCRTLSAIKSEPQTSQSCRTKRPTQVKRSAMVTQIVSRHFPQTYFTFLWHRMHTNKHKWQHSTRENVWSYKKWAGSSQKKVPCPTQIYQLTEIEMSVTGMLLKFCVVAILICRRIEMGPSWLIATEAQTQIYQQFCLLLPRHTWKQKDNGLLHICFLIKFHFFGVRIFLVHFSLCLRSEHVLYNVLGIDLDSYKYCILKGTWNTGCFVQWVRKVSRLFVSASKLNWTLWTE